MVVLFVVEAFSTHASESDGLESMTRHKWGATAAAVRVVVVVVVVPEVEEEVVEEEGREKDAIGREEEEEDGPKGATDGRSGEPTRAGVASPSPPPPSPLPNAGGGREETPCVPRPSSWSTAMAEAFKGLEGDVPCGT